MRDDTDPTPSRTGAEPQAGPTSASQPGGIGTPRPDRTDGGKTRPRRRGRGPGGNTGQVPQGDKPARRGRGRRKGQGDSGRRQQHEARRERQRAARAAREPLIEYPAELPVVEHREEIAEAIRDHQVVVIAGETGSGKTTQIPKICLELGLGVDGMIGHTQPRRIAARSVAARLAEEMAEDLGDTVGYQVRFTSQVADHTRVKVMTDGILLSELRHDRLLRDYEVLIIDEAHERSLNIDFIIGFLTELLPKRPDLKVVITSATINPEAFSEHFGGAPIISVSGRTYPVEVRYRPLDPNDAGGSAEDDEGNGDLTRGGAASRAPKDQVEGILDAFDELTGEAPGDILVFLSGEREIRDAADALTDHVQKATLKGPRRRGADWEVVPLYARLSSQEQQRVFRPHGRPRVVLATNVAETSLTVPGIKYVIDTGVARISRYSNRTKVQRLPIEPVSQASANQRKGRSGRTSDGIAIRLYSQADFESRPEFTDPEILRTNLASVILQMVNLGFARTEKEVTDFPFLTPPDPRAVRDGRTLLSELGALKVGQDSGLTVTDIGRKLAALPIDPRLARMVIAGAQNGCGAEVAVIVAALSTQDPRERPAEQRGEADALHARFTHARSDFLSFLALWNYVREQSQTLSSSKFRRTIRGEFLNYVRIREWQDLVGQLRSIAGSAGIQLGEVTWKTGADEGSAAGGKRDPSTSGPFDAQAVAIHKALLTGLLSMIGQKLPDGREYQGARGARFQIFPGSGLFKKGPDFVMSAELVETSRLWARTVAWADPDWVVDVAGDLVKRTYAEPRWSGRSGQAVANEKATLYGVTLYTERPVSYARIDRTVARELFLRHALVEGDWRETHAFLQTNANTLAEAEELASRTRDRRVLSGEDDLYAFYDDRVPEDVLTASDFTGWWRKKRREDPAFLDVPLETLLAEDAADRTADLAHEYPTHWVLPARNDEESEARAELRYSFEPGTEGDGVTAEIQVGDLDQADPHAFSWQVPGLRIEFMAALIRSLPKAKRTYFVPAPDVARDILAHLRAAGEEGLGSLPEVLAVELTARGGGGRLEDRNPITVTPADFDWSRVPAHLRLRFRLMRGRRVLTEGFDLAAMQADQRKRQAAKAAKALARAQGSAAEAAAAGRGGSAPQAAGAQTTAAEAAAGTRGPRTAGAGQAGAGVGPAGAGASRAGGAGRSGERGSGGRTSAPVPTREQLVDRVVAGASAVLSYAKEHLSTQEKLVLAGHQKTSDALLEAVLRVAARGEIAAAGMGADGRYADMTGTADVAATSGTAGVSDMTGTSRGAGASGTAGASGASGADRAPGAAPDPDVLSRAAQGGLTTRMDQLLPALIAALTAMTTLEKKVSKASSLVILANLADVKEWREQMGTAEAIAGLSEAALLRLPRWVEAANVRIDAMVDQPPRDRQLMDRMLASEAAVSKKLATTRPDVAALGRAARFGEVVDPGAPSSGPGRPASGPGEGWHALLFQQEELRLSLFAPSLGAIGKVSEQRIAKSLTKM
ncbi:ATP-dependent RNA helicase HrpA [Brevibacterium yomogidense]|uniref:ATP-dependent RNA helicase HrpA n=1 Tax=Brevibacterium yomogidense TaxID=946573 RepID=UPI0018E005E6|nr:ATP-dependent RNA helicase HrpA [Brevibacterium yomogidense]